MTTYKKELQESISYWKLRQLKAQAEKLEIENAERKKELIKVEEVVNVLSEVLGQLKARLLALPRSIATKLEMVSSAEAEKILDAEIRFILKDTQEGIEKYLSTLAETEESQDAQGSSGKTKTGNKSKS